jgi:hypothetical protein
MHAVTTIGLDIAKSVFQPAEAPVRFAILSEAAVVPRRYRSL